MSNRSRSANWTPAMKELLIESVKPFSDIVETKLNDGKSLKSKFEAWETIEGFFKASGYGLSAKQIRDQWNRMKTKARTNLSEFSRSQKETGGGTPPKEPSEIDFQISAIAAIDFVDDTAEFDSNEIYGNEKENLSPQPTANTPTVKSKTPIKTTRFTRKSRKLPTMTTSDELLKKRIAQIEMETKKKEHILNLKEQVLLKKLQVQERKLVLVELKINSVEQNLFSNA